MSQTDRLSKDNIGLAPLFLILAWDLLVSLFFVFLDGYTFVMANAMRSAFIFSVWLLSDLRIQKKIGLILLQAVSAGAAFFAYSLYSPETSFYPHSPEIFTHLSIHLPSLLVPTEGFSILFDTLGLSTVRTEKTHVGTGLWNHETVFLSWTLLLFSAGALFWGTTQKALRLACLLLIGGGLCMAIGPFIPELSGTVPYSDSLMYGRQVLAKNIAHYLYDLPGLEQMRATYRWALLVKLGLWLLSCMSMVLVCHRFAACRKWLWIVPLLVLMETSAKPVTSWQNGVSSNEMAEALSRDLVSELTEVMEPGAKVLVLSVTNDFVVHSVAAQARLFFYNVAGDKNLAFAESKRPPIIERLLDGGACFGRNLNQAHGEGLIDFVAFRMFDSHRGARGWHWPPSAEEIEANRRTAEGFWSDLSSDALLIGKYFWILPANVTVDHPGSGSCR